LRGRQRGRLGRGRPQVGYHPERTAAGPRRPAGRQRVVWNGTWSPPGSLEYIKVWGGRGIHRGDAERNTGEADESRKAPCHPWGGRRGGRGRGALLLLGLNGDRGTV